MIDREHQTSVYAELIKQIDPDKPVGDRKLYMNSMTARQLIDADNDPKFRFSADGATAYFCHIPIVWSRNNRIELRNGDELLYSIVWDPNPYNKVTATDPTGTTQAMRFNEGKLEWSLIDFKQLEGMVRVLQFGAKKYDRDNWKKGLPMRQQCESMMRHLVAIMSGEVRDKETGEYHWHCIQCNAMFMGHTYENHPQHIDIPTPNFNGK